MITLRPMREDDLPLLRTWLARPHFARWILQDATVESELADSLAAIRGEDPASVLIVEYANGTNASTDDRERDGHRERDIGWAQHYRWSDYPDAATAYSAAPGDHGIDYGIGEPDLIGAGLGTELVAALVRRLHAEQPSAAILTGPSAGNRASCRALERNGFALVDVRDVAGEPNASPLALYRLDP